MKRGKITGNKVYYLDGNKYEGDFKNDVREGKGIFYFHNGDKYEGDFKNDVREGKGIFIFIMVINIKEIIKIM